MSYLLLFFYFAILIVIISRAKFFQSAYLPKYVPILIFILKFTAGISVYLVYAYFYGSRISGDIFKYFDDGNIIYSALHQNPVDYLRMLTGIGAKAPHLSQYYDTCHFWIKDFNYGLLNDNRIVIRFNALFRLISMGNIHIHTLFMSFLSFTGLWFLLRTFEATFQTKKWGLVLVVFFFPSSLFWTSGLLKEGILTFAFGMLIYQIYGLINNKKTGLSIACLVLSIGILFLSKFYVLVAALPGLIYVLVASKLKIRNTFAYFIGIHLILLSLLWFTKPFIGVDFPKIIVQKQNDFIAYVNSLEQAGSKIEMAPLQPTFKNLIKEAPKAFVTTLLRPTIFEIHSPMVAMAAIENLFILVLLLLTMLHFTKLHLNNPWLWFCVSFVIILFTLIGLTTPILGALVRYKAPALPFLGIIILYLTKAIHLKKDSKHLL
ncbi:MAG: hypothetical protein CVU09_14255 [Bacteroidetes bacterium HGW-Bacteroidetes-4]|jgi:hypothetical protein|nr:MAG: hypothetical protein CVU09_14255 [Bacteroidetes bacterium HGW-Bacteroidetes-4]